METQQPINPENNQGLLNSSSPKVLYSTYVLSIARGVFDALGPNDEEALDRKAQCLCAFVLDADEQMRIWKQYEADREKTNVATAAIALTGKVIRSLSQSLEWTESSFGGWG